MNYREIEALKSVITDLTRKGCVLQIPAYGVKGKVIGVGFRPYWTNPADSKIDKIELNLIDENGQIIPFNFSYITGYDIISGDKQRSDNAKEASFDIHVYSPGRSGGREPYDKVRLDLRLEDGPS